MHIVNLGNFRKHLMRSWHMSRGRAPNNVQFLILKSACRNIKKYGRNGTTNFLRQRPPTLGSPSNYKPIEFKEIVALVEETIRYGKKYINRRGHMEAMQTFNQYIGVLFTFKNERDERSRYEIKKLRRIKVLYDVLPKDMVKLITAFPLWQDQEKNHD